MKWIEKRGKIEQLINANLDWQYEETQFYEKLLKILDTSTNQVSFMRKASREANVYTNPWFRDDLLEFVNTLENTESIL